MKTIKLTKRQYEVLRLSFMQGASSHREVLNDETWDQDENLISKEALKKYNCFRLSARIFDLKQQNINIETDHVTLKNGKRVAQYKLIKEAK